MAKSPKEFAHIFLDGAKFNLQAHGNLTPSTIMITEDGKTHVMGLATGAEWNDPTQRDRVAFWLRRKARELKACTIVHILDSYRRDVTPDVLKKYGETLESFAQMPDEQRWVLSERLRKDIEPTEAINIILESSDGCYSIIQDYVRNKDGTFTWGRIVEDEQTISGRFAGMLPKKANAS